MNLFLRELRAYRKSTIIWAVSLAAIVVVFLSLFPAFTRDVEATTKLFDQLPAAVKLALSISTADFFSIYGFYGYLLSFAVLAGAIQAMSLGTGIISKEVAGKTADFLLSKPITRSHVVTSKLAAAFLMLLATDAVFFAVSYVTALSVSTASFAADKFFLLASTLTLVQMMFLALGALFGVVIPKVKSVISVSLPTVFTFYIIGTLGAILGNDSVKYITPFKYFDTSYVIRHGAFESKFLVLGAIVFVVAIAASFAIYVKRDVRASS
ncbi:MAG: ABC transporter permease subunit [Coriobacteriia bacterium]|nr:ABC transporter permease subunit [Coriobacteriia bacterium]